MVMAPGPGGFKRRFDNFIAEMPIGGYQSKKLDSTSDIWGQQ